MDENETYLWCGVFRDLNSEDRLSLIQLVIKGGAVKGTPDQIGARLGRTRTLALLRVKAD
jgi:hypothetical protein